MSSHRALLVRSRTCIERTLRIVTRASNVAPWDVFVLVADAQGQFGQEIAKTITETQGSCAAFRGFDDSGSWLCVPLLDDGGIDLLSEYAPFLIQKVIHRPSCTVALFVVDADDEPTIAFGRLIAPGVS